MKDIKRIVDDQIKNQTRERLGGVEIKNVKSFLFKQEIDKDTLKPLVWTKKYYSFDRGISFPISSQLFKNYQSVKRVYLPASPSGTLVDGGLDEFANVLYSVSVYSKDGIKFALPIETGSSTNINVDTYYVDTVSDIEKTIVKTEIVSPSASYFGNGNISIELPAGKWVTLEITLYRSDIAGFIICLKDIINFIDDWKLADTESPDKPVWSNIPITTSSNPISGITSNILSWEIPTASDWAGHLIYRKTDLKKGSISEPVIPDEPITVGLSGKISNSGNQGFLLNGINPDGFNSGSIIDYKGRKLTVIGYDTIKGNLVDNGDFSLYTNHFINWKMVSSPVVANAFSTAIFYNDNAIGGVCIGCSAKSTGTKKSIYLWSSAYIAVDRSKDYLLDLRSNYVSGIRDSLFGIQFFQNSSGTLCSTPFYSKYYNTSAGWHTHSLILRHHTSNSHDGIPSTCNYIKLKNYITINTTLASSRKLDGIKFSTYSPSGIFVTQTSDSTFVRTRENLTVPYNKFFRAHVPLNSSTSLIGGIIVQLGNVNKRTGNVFNSFGGGYELSRPVLNYIKNGKFDNLTNWTQSVSNCLKISTSGVFNPPFGKSCGILTGKESNKLAVTNISQAISGAPTTRGSYLLSIYAKAGTCNNLYLAQQVKAIVDATTIPLTKEWKRYYLISTANSFQSSKNAFVGIPVNNFGTVHISGLQLQYRSTVTNFYPDPFNDKNTDGITTNSSGALRFIQWPNTLINPNTGTMRIYYTPDYDYNKMYNKKYVLSGTNAISGNPATDRIECYYNPGTRKFVFNTLNAGVSSSAVSTVQSFLAGERICLHLLWNSTQKRIATDGIVGNPATKNFPATVDNIYLGTYYNTATANDYGMPANGVLSEFIVTDNEFNSKSLFIDSQATGVSPSPDKNNLSSTITGYQYQLIGDRRRTSEDIPHLVDGVFVSTALIYTHTPVIPNDKYTYILSAYDFEGNPSVYSDEQSTIAGDKIPPGPVTDTSATSGFGIVTYKWKNPTDLDFAKNKIYKTNVYSTPNVLDIVAGNRGSFASWTQSTSTGNHSIYVTTLDFNNNENKNGVRITGSSLSVDSIVENTDIYVEWTSDPPNGNYFKSDATKTFKIIVTCDTPLTYPNSNYGIAIYGANNTKFYGTTSAFLYQNRGNTHQYQLNNVAITFSDTDEGYGAIKFKGSLNGSDIRQQIPINLDKTVPTTPTITLKQVSGTSPNYSGGKQIITGQFSGLTTDAYQCQLSTTASYSTNGWYSDFNACPLVLPDYAKTYTIRGFVRDNALNVSAASGSVNYAFAGVGIKPSITVKNTSGTLIQPNSDSWYNQYLVVELKGETTAPNAITRLDYTVKRHKPTGLGDLTGNQTGVAATLTRNISFGGATADAVNEIILTATDRNGNNATTNLIVQQDDTKPVPMASIWDSTVTGFHNNAAYLKWKRGSTDNLSGLKQYNIYRAQTGVAGSNRRIGTVSSVVTWFDDTEDILEGYVSYDYSLQVEDFASNTATGVAKSINLVAPWDRTFRNWFDNGSLDRDNNQSWQFTFASLNTTTKLSGKQSVFLSGASNYINQYVMLPEFSSTFIKSDDRWVMSFYQFNKNISTKVQIFYFDATGINIPLSSGLPDEYTTFNSGVSSYDAQNNEWGRKYIVLNPNSWMADTLKRGKSVHVAVVIGYPVAGSCYIDNLQWEERKSTDTTPTKFVDNHTLTADRFHVGFLRANMIKTRELHSGLIVAEGLVIDDQITGAPYLQIGRYDSTKSFLRFSNYGGYRHFPGQALANGFSIIDHVESGMANFSAVTFRSEYKDWQGNPVIPKVITSPITTETYRPTYAALIQNLDVRKEISSTGFTQYTYLVAGDTLLNGSGGISAMANGVNKTVALTGNVSSQLKFSDLSVNWSATESSYQALTFVFEGFRDSNNDGTGDVWEQIGQRTVSSNQDETISYEFQFGNVSLNRYVSVRVRWVNPVGSGFSVTGYWCYYELAVAPPLQYVQLDQSYQWMAFHNLY